VTQYLVVFAVVFIANVVPAFAPPTWSILVFLTLHYDLNNAPAILLGVLAAATGRFILASTFRRYREKFPKWYLENMENAASHLTKSDRHFAALASLFFVSPLSSAQLFEAAGIMKSIALKPLTIAFAAGRLVTYTIYVSGASVLKESSFGDVILNNIKSPTAIAIQILMVIGLVALGSVKWKPHRPHNEQPAQ
jgi:membrane protein DedA with SNARE-associated domain